MEPIVFIKWCAAFGAGIGLFFGLVIVIPILFIIILDMCS